MLVSTSSMLYSVQSRFIFTRAAEREKEEREDMFYLSVDDGGGNNLSSSDSSSSSSSSDGLSSSGSSDGSSDEWGDPDPTWVVDENEEAMKREWREREKQKEMLRKRAEIKKRLKAERERRANALGALNAYHRKHHHHDGPAATTGATSGGGGGGMSVVWDGEVGDEDHREEDMHDRKRDSLALGRARASSLSSDGSGSVLLLPGGLPQSGLFGLKSSASLVRKQPLATGSGSGNATTTSSSPPVPRRGPAASSSLEAPRLGKARALAASPLAASQSVWRPQPVFAPATAAGSLSTSPRMVVSPESSPSSSTSTSPSPSPRKATTSSKHGSRRRHSRSMNSTTTAAAANEPSPSSGQRGAEAFERPRAYSAGPQLPPSRDKPKRKGKKERKDKTEKKEKKEKKKEKKEKKEVKREKSSAGKRNSKGARLVRALSGGKLTRTGGSTDHDRIKRESFTGVNPALLSDSAAQDNPYIAEYRRERNTPRGGWPATPTTTSQAHEAVDNGAENEDDEKNECAATAEKNEATRGAAIVREAEEEVVEKKRRGTDSPRNGGSGRRQKTNGSSSSAASHSSGSGVALAPRRGVTSTSTDSTTRSVKPAIPVLSLGTMSAVRVEPHPHQADAEAEADTLGSEGSSSNAGSGIGSRLGAITPRMVEGFRSIVKKLGKNTTDDRIDRPAGEETAYGDDGEESEEPLSYSGSGSGSDSSESEEVRQRRRMRKRKLEKKRSMSERSLHRSRSLSPTRRTRDLLVGDPQPA
ncbi:uncharacterized protein ACA1_326900, partial [Acanthamoeba castellanii str. Neff]